MDFLTNNIALVLGVAIVVVGLLGIGLRDVARFSFYRVWAISGVSFDESIRRKVLWITPLAIVGVILVSQLTRPFDEQDAIRQTIKFSIFATGMVVALAAIILAATNLPKEIENRVIYTIVTKPTTRLEIIVGKVIGFARVSAAILLIMGLFTWGYLHVRSWMLQKDIAASLASPGLSTVQRSALEHYRDFGLLTAKHYAWPGEPQILARAPEADIRWIPGGAEASARLAFFHAPEAFAPAGVAPGNLGLALALELGYEQSRTIMPDHDPLEEYGIPLPTTRPGEEVDRVPAIPTPLLPPRPRVRINIVDADGNAIVPAEELGELGRGVMLPRSERSGQLEQILLPIPAEAANRMVNARGFYIEVSTPSRGTQLALRLPSPERSPVSLQLFDVVAGRPVAELLPRAANEVDPLALFRGREGTFGQQLRGESENAPVALFPFRNVKAGVVGGGKIAFEMRVGIERSGSEQSLESDDFTTLHVHLIDPKTGKAGEPVEVLAESNRNVYFDLPAELAAGGDFDLVMRNITPGHWVGVRDTSVQLVIGNSHFAWNLLKSLLVLWLMSILVVVIAIFCSTFLSWPIAIVLTVVILLGNWGVQQIGETGSSFGNQVAEQMFGGEGRAAQYRVVSASVNALNTFLHTVATVLPDISQFKAGEELERGVSVPWFRLGDAAKVAFGFGLPLSVLAYIFLRYKEVAP